MLHQIERLTSLNPAELFALGLSLPNRGRMFRRLKITTPSPILDLPGHERAEKNRNRNPHISRKRFEFRLQLPIYANRQIYRIHLTPQVRTTCTRFACETHIQAYCICTYTNPFWCARPSLAQQWFRRYYAPYLSVPFRFPPVLPQGGAGRPTPAASRRRATGSTCCGYNVALLWAHERET